jgi:CspA family cold shock protein
MNDRDRGRFGANRRRDRDGGEDPFGGSSSSGGGGRAPFGGAAPRSPFGSERPAFGGATERPAFGGADRGGFRERPASGPEQTAVVKWFKADKGFGFVELENGGGDAFLHGSALARAGHGTVSPGATLRVKVSAGQKGPQVAEVTSVDTSTATAPAGGGYGGGGGDSYGGGGYDRPAGGGYGGAGAGFGAPRDRAPSRPPMQSGPTTEIRGTVKWYNASKGFGFVVPDNGGKDVFVHATALERSGLSNLDEGQAVKLDVAEGRRGAEAVKVELG